MPARRWSGMALATDSWRSDPRNRSSVIGSLVAILCVLMILGAVGIAVQKWSSGDVAKKADVSVPTDVHAMDGLGWPAEFKHVEKTWGCDAGPGTLCFVTDLDGTSAARQLAATLGVDSVEVTMSGRWGDRYSVCNEVGSTPVVASVYPRVSNAVLRNGALVVPPRVEPETQGLAVFASVTDTPCDQL